jgi:hypothetical protein
MRTKTEEAEEKRAKKAAKNEYAPGTDGDITAADRKKQIAALMSKINTHAKYQVIAPADEVVNPYFLRRPSGIMQLDIDTGGGMPAGGVSMLSGPDNCLSGSTLIHHEVRTPEGLRATHKWVTIERLYERFHRLPHDGKGNWQIVEEGRTFHAPSMNDDLGIVQNRIVDVVKAGEKECFEVITESGQRIEATAEHKFFNGQKYVPLKELQEGNVVYVHINTRREKEGEESDSAIERKMFYVAYHPTARKKDVRDSKSGKVYTYYVLPRSRAVVEASMNDMSLEAYIERLNDGWKLKYLTPDQIVHHEDENVLNDERSNLIVTDRAEHMREHLKDAKRDNYFRFMATPDTVVSIESIGLKMTYDLKMEAPYHNFIANNFVVHNSGKSYLLYKYFAQHQRLYGPNSSIALAPVEGAPDYFFMRRCGFMVAIPDPMIDERNARLKERGLPIYTKEQRAEMKRQTGSVQILAAQNGEDLLDAVHEAVRSNLFGIIGIDSISAIQPMQIAKQDTLHENGQRASHASLVTNFFQRLYPFLVGMWGRNDTTILCTQQVRANPKKAEAASFVQKFIKDWAPAGAYAAKHGKMIDLLVWDGGSLRKGKEGGEVIGKRMVWETEKGKAGTHDNIRGEVDFFYDRLTDDLVDIVTTGIRYNAIVEQDGYMSLVRAQTGELFDGWKRLAGIKRFIDKMQENPANEFFVRQEILAHAGIECAFL